MIQQADSIASGIYRDVPFDEYLSWSAISNSRLTVAARSLAHYQLHVSVEESPSMRLGSLCHAGQLEPLEVARRFAVMPRFELRCVKADGTPSSNPKMTKQYRDLVEEFTAANEDKTVVTAEEYRTMMGVVQSLAHSETASRFLNNAEHEVSIVWRDNSTGLACKGRIDALKSGLVTDLKTMADATQAARNFANRGYYRQLAFYADGMTHLTGEPHSAAMVVAETQAPYCVLAAPVSEEAMDVGRREYRELLEHIASSLVSGVWPGYESPAEWTLPKWKLTESEESCELVIGGETIRI